VEVPVKLRGHLRELLRERHERSPKKPACRCSPEEKPPVTKRRVPRA
jgi:hypothetical protein